MTRLIVKVQRPTIARDVGRSWLFYDQNKLRKVTVPEAGISGDLKRAMGERLRIYIYADYSDVNGTYGFLGVAPDQPW